MISFFYYNNYEDFVLETPVAPTTANVTTKTVRVMSL